MNFLYPLGLLGLLGIPILIIIYIIKSKYSEQTVASTYLWRLSEQFLKRRNPFNPLAGMISLILQILAVTVLSLAIAHPVFIIPGAADEYCFILDGSAGMNMKSGEGTRFDEAKAEIIELIDDAAEGSVFTLISVGETTATVFEKLGDEKEAKELVQKIRATYVEDDYTDAMALAQAYFNDNSSMRTYLITDKNYDAGENVTVVRVGEAAVNVALAKPVYTVSDGVLSVGAELTSYSGDSTVTLELYLNGSGEPAATEIYNLTADTPLQVSFTANVSAFGSATLRVKEEDCFILDNTLTVLDLKNENSYSVLIVSDQPFFIKSALTAIGCTDVDVVDTEDYTDGSGYGLYIFESFVPEALPSDGSVWMINPKGSVPDAGFSVQGEMILESQEALELTKASSSTAVKLAGGIFGEDLYIRQYVKCGLYKNFTTILSYKGNPVVFAGTNNYGNRLAVMALDLHASNLPLMIDFITLTENLFEYSFPYVVDSVQYHAGDVMTVNVPAGAQSVEIVTPSGESVYLSTESASAEHTLSEVGDYAVMLTVGGVKRQINVYSAVPEAESATDITEEGVSLLGEAGNEGRDGEYDPLVILFILLAVIFAADWMVYCYDKYQLR